MARILRSNGAKCQHPILLLLRPVLSYHGVTQTHLYLLPPLIRTKSCQAQVSDITVVLVAPSDRRLKTPHIGEAFRYPVIELAAPPQDLKRDDGPPLVPRKNWAVATGTTAIPTPDPIPERQANRANRKHASTHARIAPIAKRSSTHVKRPGSFATHVEYPLSGTADAGSSPDLTRRGDSFTLHQVVFILKVSRPVTQL